jgi:hypothetical protein
LSEVKSVLVKVSDMFSVVEKAEEANLYLANMPQTPFRNSSSRPDKNGGHDSLKFN